ncbi:MAG: hypothetical protein Sapg2KO_34040 [Saprospiraceae bacterium]
MDMLNKIQNLLSKNNKKGIASNQKTDKAPQTNENKATTKKLGDKALKEIYGTTHLFI